MSISDTGSTSSSSSSCEFNFNAWIEQNNFTTIKQLFIKHKMCSLNDLNMFENKTFGPFIADIITKDPTLAQPIVTALQTLNPPPKIKIRATDEEFAVEELIDNKVNKLNKIKENICSLQNKYIENKNISCKNIVKIENNINNEFNMIKEETNRQKNILSEKLNQFISHFEDNLENKIVILGGLINKIQNEIKLNESQLKKVKELLDNNSLRRDIRKQQILNIGENIYKISSGCEYYENELHKNDLYNINNNNNNIEIFRDKKSYDKIFKYLKKCIKLKYDYNVIGINITEQSEGKCDDNMSENMNNINSIKLNEIILQKDNDINIIKCEKDKLNENIKELNVIIVNKDKKIMQFENKITILNKEIINKKSTIEIMNEKYNRIKNENGQLRTSINKKQTFLDEKNGLLEAQYKKYDKLNKKYMFLDENNAKLENKLNKKRDKIKQINELNKRKENMNDEGAMNAMNAMNDWANEIQKCMQENDKLKSKQNDFKIENKELQTQIINLQKKIKQFNGQKEEIKKLRGVCNDYRNKLREGNNSGVSMAMRFKNNRIGEYKKIVKKMDKFNGNNGKIFVEKFVKLLGKKVNDNVDVKYVNKGKDKVWRCWIKIPEIGIDQKYEHKNKKNSINAAWKQVAGVIDGWRK